MKYYLSLILFFLLINFTLAQDSSKTNQDILKHGLQFQLRSLLELTNFNGYTFSYRYRFNNNSGIRIGIFTSVNESDYDITQQLDSIISSPPNYSHNYSFKLSFQYLKNLINYKSFSLIFGGGPFISYSKSESSSDYLSSSYSRNYTSKDKTTGFGIDLILGVEYSLIENVLLSGEYGITVSKENSNIDDSENYIYTDTSQNRIYRENGERHSVFVRGMGVNLGISVFF